jgi:protein-disulfide isomerase
MSTFHFRRFSILLLLGILSFISVSATASVVSGNPRGNIVVEEYFDYQCPHCRIMLGSMTKLVSNNSNVKLVTRVIPIMGRNSWFIAQAALAARNQGKYAALHYLLMQQREYITNEQLLNLAQRAGINIPKLQRDMRSSSIRAELNANISASRRQGVNIIPATIIFRADNQSSGVRLVGDKSYGELQQTISNL